MNKKILLIDTREKPRAILKIQEYFKLNHIRTDRTKLYVGDYQFLQNPYIVVDRKQNIAELAKNCTVDSQRFKAELERAREAGVTVVVLVEQNRYVDRKVPIHVRGISDLIRWTNPHSTIRGEQIFRILSGWVNKYPLRIEFCDKRSTGKRIIEILEESNER